MLDLFRLSVVEMKLLLIGISSIAFAVVLCVAFVLTMLFLMVKRER